MNLDLTPSTEGQLIGAYMDFDRTAHKTWTNADYLLRFAAFVESRALSRVKSALLAGGAQAWSAGPPGRVLATWSDDPPPKVAATWSVDPITKAATRTPPNPPTPT